MRSSCVNLVCILAAAAARLLAQQVVAPTPSQVGPLRGENTGDYNVVNSIETGYRFSLVDGNLGKYRSDVNFRNGLRVLGSSLTVNSRDGHGHFFDELVLTTLGLGNDPYESAMLRVQKNRLYRYDMLWRLNDYYNPGLVPSNGLHFMDTTRRMQDHDLILFPPGKFRLRAGYSRNSQDGPALSTTQVFDSRGSEFPFFANVRREFNDYRLGGDVELFKVKLTFQHRWEFFKEDTGYQLLAPTAGDNPGNDTTLTQFRRAEPYHGSTPSWLLNLFTERSSFAVNGRFTYSGGERNFILDETATGTDRFLNAQNRQILVFGDARRPVVTGDLSVSFFATSRMTLVNNTSFHNTRIDGNSTLRQFNNRAFTNSLLDFQFLGIRLITNSTDAQFRFSKTLRAYAGYRYSTRLIRSIESTTVPSSAFQNELSKQSNRLHSGVTGINWSPVAPLRFHVEGEIGRANNPFTPWSERNYHAISARAQYKWKSLLASAGYRQNDNNNSVTLTSYSSRARNYFADISWTPRSSLGLDASYSRLHLDTVGGLAFFAGSPRPQLIADRQSHYLSNIHALNFGVRATVGKRIDVYAGYSLTRDAGDGRASGLPAADPINALLFSVKTFPLTFQSPSARLSVRLRDNLRWNAGYQFYGYHERFGLLSVYQNYHAHTGFTSLLWSF